MTERHAWQGQPYLDELRPDPSASVRLALFATYSVDVSAVAATLLALVGKNNEKGSGSAVDFTQAIDRLAGKVQILIQRGRIARPVVLPKIAGILDQFIVEQPHDEQTRSWHPKIALVAYDAPSAPSSWKLWIGSRNLTRSRDLDVGVLLNGGSKRGKNKVLLAGIGEVAARLADDAGRSDGKALAEELKQTWWEAPPGYELRLLFDALGDGVALPPGPPPGKLHSVTIVSPFLSPAFLKEASGWGPDGARTLISTMPSLVEIANRTNNYLASFSHILAYAVPDTALDEQAVAPNEADAAADDDAEPAPLSLHAKIYCFDMDGDCIIRVGSANATDRAWSGRNAEIMLELRAGAEFSRGLQFLIGLATPVVTSELEKMQPSDKSSADALEKSRRHLVATWTPLLLRDGEKFTLDAGIVPELEHPGHKLQVGHANGDLIPWPVGASVLKLGSIPLSLQSEFIHVQITGPAGELAWMQRVEVIPSLEKGRDLAALARHMGLRAFHEWVRTRLNGDTLPTDDTPWDEEPGNEVRRRSSSAYDRLTLEDILSAWAKDNKAFERVDQIFVPYVDAILAHAENLSEKDKTDLHELSLIWQMARERLLS